MTGLAQIQQPADLNLESVRRKLALDLVYIQRRSLWLDLRLYMGTALYLMGCSYRTVRRLMRLPQGAPMPMRRDRPVDPNGPIVPNSAPLGTTKLDPDQTPEMSSV